MLSDTTRICEMQTIKAQLIGRACDNKTAVNTASLPTTNTGFYHHDRLDARG